MDIQKFETEIITKSGFACVRDNLTDRLLITSDICDLLNEQYQKILDLQKQLEEKNKEIEMIKEKYDERLTKTNEKLIEILQKIK